MTADQRISFVFLLLIFIPVTACTGLPNHQPNQITPNTIIQTKTPGQSRPTPTSPPLFVQWAKESKQWLKDTSCSAPCWNGITPGKTTVREAIALLKNSPLIDPETVQITRRLCGFKDEFEISNSRKLIWKWSVSPAFYTEDGSISYSQQNPPETYPCGGDLRQTDTILPDDSTNNGIITQIILSFPGPMDANQNYFLLPTLGEIMDAYGEPSHIVAVYGPELSWYDSHIIYEKQGLILTKNERRLFDLDKDTYFVHLTFSTNPLQEGLGGFDTSVLNVWQGLKSFNFYCKLENGQPCQ